MADDKKVQSQVVLGVRKKKMPSFAQLRYINTLFKEQDRSRVAIGLLVFVVSSCDMK